MGKMTFLLFASLVLVSANALGASTTVFDNLTETAYGGGGHWTGYDADSDQTVFVGQKFTATVPGFISSITLSAWGNETVHVDIYMDKDGRLGSHVATLDLTGKVYWGTYASGAFKEGVQLTGGSSYWVVLGQTGENWYGMQDVDAKDTFYIQDSGNKTAIEQSAVQSYLSDDGALGMKVCLSSADGTDDCSKNWTDRMNVQGLSPKRKAIIH
jgi:hypothetical protein